MKISCGSSIALVAMWGKIRRRRLSNYPNLAFKASLCGNDRIVKYLLILVSLLASPAIMSQTSPSAPSCGNSSDEIVAAPVSHAVQLDAAHPAKHWQAATPVSFCSDWAGQNADPARQTTVRVMWSAEMLYLRFECKYRSLTLFSDSDENGRRDHLWDRDVAEAFLQPDPSKPHYYKEFEVAPNGLWIDLDISPGAGVDLKSGLKRSVWLDKANQAWAAELAIPIRSLTSHFDPGTVWRANFYRVEGAEEPRAYLAWRPTNSPKPNFHVPSAFGKLRFGQRK
jgi:alpha-galactosidase